jgi:hypothetical protein
MRVQTQLQVVAGLFLLAGLAEIVAMSLRRATLSWPHDVPAVVVIIGLVGAARFALLVVLGAALLSMGEVLLAAREQGELHVSIVARMLVGPLARPAVVAVLGFLWLGTARVSHAIDRPVQKK